MTLHYLIDDQFTTSSLFQKDYVKANSGKEAVLKYLGSKNIACEIKKGKGNQINIKATPINIDTCGSKYYASNKRAVWFYAIIKEKY